MKVDMMFDCRGDDSGVMDPATREKVASYVTKRVGDFTCPDHGKQPTVVVQGERLDEIAFDVRGCCQKAIVLVKEKLNA